MSTLWGVSRLHWAPPDVWVQALHEHAFSLLPYFEPQHCVYLMCSLADLRARPSKVRPPARRNAFICAGPNLEGAPIVRPQGADLAPPTKFCLALWALALAGGPLSR